VFSTVFSTCSHNRCSLQAWKLPSSADYFMSSRKAPIVRVWQVLYTLTHTHKRTHILYLHMHIFYLHICTHTLTHTHTHTIYMVIYICICIIHDYMMIIIHNTHRVAKSTRGTWWCRRTLLCTAPSAIRQQIGARQHILKSPLYSECP
jgi:hypothetical protein